MRELKPCPFCGGDNIKFVKDKETQYLVRYAIYCEDCPAEMTDSYPRLMQNEEEVWIREFSEKWNTRALSATDGQQTD